MANGTLQSTLPRKALSLISIRNDAVTGRLPEAHQNPRLLHDPRERIRSSRIAKQNASAVNVMTVELTFIVFFLGIRPLKSARLRRANTQRSIAYRTTDRESP